MNRTITLQPKPTPYPSRAAFVQETQHAATEWFAAKEYLVHPDRAYSLHRVADWRQNIILPEVAQYIDDEIEARGKQFALNGQVHHGLSSQAMLFNLLGPLAARGDLEPLQTACENVGIAWPSGQAKACFEEVNIELFNEDYGQPTSLDLVIKNNHHAGSIFIEAKFTETGFGGCSVFGRGDCDGQNPAGNFNLCYLQSKARRQYWERMAQHGFLQGETITASKCMFAHYYQFFREVLYAIHQGGTFVLLHDERSPVFVGGRRSWMSLLMPLVPAEHRESIKIITVQSVFSAIVASKRHDDWTGEFARKYGLTL